MPGVGGGAGALVISSDRAWRTTIEEQLSEAGFRIGAADRPDVGLVVIEQGIDGAGARELASLRSTYPAARFALVGLPPMSEGSVENVSPFEPVATWLRRLFPVLLLLFVVAVEGCGGQPDASKARVPSAAAVGWSEQLKAVRAGRETSLIVAAPISLRQWEQLGSGCEQLEVLEVTLSEGVPYDFEQLKPLSALRRLKLDGPVDDSQASQLAELEHLTQLVLSSEVITDAGVRELGRLPLVQLRLEAPLVTDGAMGAIGDIESLRFLHLVRVQLTDAGLPPLQKLPNLESLYLDGAKCTEEGLSRLLKARPDLHFHRDQVHLKDDPRDHPH